MKNYPIRSLFFSVVLFIAFSSCNKDEVQPNASNNGNPSAENEGNSSEDQTANWPILLECDLGFSEASSLNKHFEGKSFFNTGSLSMLLDSLNSSSLALIQKGSNGYTFNIASMLYNNKGQYHTSVSMKLVRKSGSTKKIEEKTYQIGDTDFNLEFSVKTFSDTLKQFKGDENTDGLKYKGVVVVPEGSVTFTSIDYTTNTVKGTFQFKGYTEGLNALWEEIFTRKITVTNGTFEGKFMHDPYH